MPLAALAMGNLGSNPGTLPRRLGPWLGALAVAALSPGCGGASPPPAPPPPVPGAELKSPASLDHGWRERELSRVPVRVRLPDAGAWRAKSSGTFTVLEHAPTRSSLTLRVVLAPRLVRPETCEADARLARPSLPGKSDASAIVEQRTISAPAGFDVRLTVGVEPASNDVRGWAVAVGAATSRCYVAVYETIGIGPRAAPEVADRLALAVSGILETMHVPSADRSILPPVGVE
jgi:hypothetical protein